MKPNAFITSLRKTSAITIAKFSRYRPDTVEEVIYLRKKYIDNLDTLNRSKKFFEKEYKGDDKDTMIAKIDAEIGVAITLLDQTPEVLTLGELSRTDEDGLYFALKMLINDLRLFFQVANMISTEGIENLCPLLVYEYPNLSLEEVTVCFAQAKKGYYKELYNRLDGAIILSWLKQYNAEKLDRLKERNYVIDAHAKIGATEQRSVNTSSELLNEAYAKLAIEKANKK